jgi:hypothetical protein
MTHVCEVEEFSVSTVEIDATRYAVTLGIAFDGVEYIGRLRFADENWDADAGIIDEVGIPGRTPNDILTAAQALSIPELKQRHRRALSTTQRSRGWRRVTEDALAHIRHLSKLSISLRAGLLDVDDAAREIDATERQLADSLRQLRTFRAA